MSELEVIEIGDIVYNERDISPSQVQVTSRQINYWIDNEVVPFVEKQQTDDSEPHTKENDKPKTRWIRLNLSQAVWVSIVKELYSYGLSTEKLAKLAEAVWHKPREDKYADKVIANHIKNNRNNLSKESINQLKVNLKDELLMDTHYRTILNPFTDMIKSVILRELLPHSMLYVPETNEYTFQIGEHSLTLDLTSVYLQHTMICIPIVPIISKVLAIDFGQPKKDLPYLTNLEKQIRDIVVFKKPKIVEIAFEDNYIKPIVISEQHKNTDQLVKYILENKIAKGSKLLIDIRSQGNYKLTLIKK